MTPKAVAELQASLATDVLAFLPEVVLCSTIVFLLLLRLVPRFDRFHLGPVALVITLYALFVAWTQWSQWRVLNYDPRLGIEGQPGSLVCFGGMVVYDNFTIFLRLFLLGFAALVIWLSMLTGIPDREDSADFYVLILGATVGMMLMASAYHLLMVFIGVEMASLPSYALAGFLKGRRQSSEASLKYVVYGGGAAGIMLYGISLIAGRFGTGYLPEIAVGFANLGGTDPMLLLGVLFVLIGIGFKLAAFPFHFWCPDVFEGAAAEVAAFLSVASKGAALALLARLALTVAGPQWTPERTLDPYWLNVASYLVPALAVFAGITATFGNLAAYAQTNLKRLLAYSTIAHAGYMMMGIATLTTDGAGAVLFYLVVYLFMNLGAFAVIAFLRNLTGSEELSSFRGLIHRAPILVITLGVFLLSLLGLPPLAGFVAKFEIFSALFDAGNKYAVQEQPGLSYTMYALLVVGGLNTVISLIYYLKVMKVMVLEKSLDEVEGRTPEPLAVPAPVSMYAVGLAAIVLVLGVYWGPLDRASRVRGVDGLVPAAPFTGQAALAAPLEREGPR